MVHVALRVLDLFSGAGGAAHGYHLAGMDVVGVDCDPQPHYPYEFIQADALDAMWRLVTNAGPLWDYGWTLENFDLIHASPPCQRWVTRAANREDLPDYIKPIRRYLRESGLPYVIENVVNAPVLEPEVLCGTMFGLPIRRHRCFETNWGFNVHLKHDHSSKPIGVYGHTGRGHGVDDWRDAMEIDWMTAAELAEAIPPAFTRFVGEQFRGSRTPG